MFENVDNTREYFNEYKNSVDNMGCPVCKRHFNTKRYISTHLKLHCPITDNLPISAEVLSQLYLEITNLPHRRRIQRSPCLIWTSFSKFLSFTRDPIEGIVYEVLLKDGSVGTVSNTQLLSSRSGSSLSKRGYRLRKKGTLPERLPLNSQAIPTQQHSSQSITPITQVSNNSNIIISSNHIQLPRIQNTNSNFPLFPISTTSPVLYPGGTDSRSIDFIISRITLNSTRIKSLKSTIAKWGSFISAPIRSVCSLILQAEDFAVSIIKEVNCSTSHQRNTLQNIIVFLRTVVTFETSEYNVAKAQAATKFLSIEIRKLNIACNKVRQQSASLDAQRLSGKWISSETMKIVSKKSNEFITLLLSKYWTQNTRFPALTRPTHSLFKRLSIEDARFFQSCLLWRLFALWTPQRSGRVQSLTYYHNLKYDENDTNYYFIESIGTQKCSLYRDTNLSTIRIHPSFSRALDFNLFFIIPKLTSSTLKSNPTRSPVLLTSRGTHCTADSINGMLTRLVRIEVPDAPRITCQLLRKLTQSFFFTDAPTLEDIEKYNLLADHSLSTSLLYYKLFTTNNTNIMTDAPQTVLNT